MKTTLQIEEMAKEFSEGSYSHERFLLRKEGYIAGYTQAQQDLKEACSDGFDDCFSKYATESNLHHEFDVHYFWQACSLLKMKEIQEKDDEITELKRALQIIYDNSRANYIDKQEKEKFRQIVEKYKLHKY